MKSSVSEVCAGRLGAVAARLMCLGGCVAGVALLSGCASTSPSILQALEDVNVQTEDSFCARLLPFDQRRSTNVSAILPANAVGELHMYGNLSRTPSMGIALSDEIGGNGTLSQVVSLTYEFDGDLSDLSTIREKILAVRVAGAELVAEKLKLVEARDELAFV